MADMQGMMLSMPTTAPPLNGANRFAHIDAMRAVAVLMVVVAHAGLGQLVPGGAGVTIFFSISGFIITYLLLRERDKTGGFSILQFYTRRAIKIAPPLMLIIVVPTLIYSCWNSIHWDAFLAQIFFVYNWVSFRGEDGIVPGTGIVWSLSIEEQFYIIFAMIWLLIVRSPQWKPLVLATAVIGVVGSTIVRLVMALDPLMTDRIYFGTDTRLDGIAWGVLAAIAFHSWQCAGMPRNAFARFVSNDWMLYIAIVGFLMSLAVRDDFFRDTFRYTTQSISACLVILYGLVPGAGFARQVVYKISTNRMISLIGLSSYSIYLVHLVFIRMIRDVVEAPLFVEVGAFTLLGVLAGIAIYKLIEVPAHNWGRQRAKSKSIAPPPAI